jgi:hypothetical protein
MPVVAGLAAADLILLGLFSIGFLYATKQLWMPALLYLLGQIPVVGGYVASRTAQLINDMFAWVGARVAGLIQPLTDAIERVITRIAFYVRAVQATLTSAGAALTHTITQLLPALEIRAQLYAATLVQALGGLVNGLYLAALREIGAVEQQLIGYALSLYQAALQAIALVNLQLSQQINQAVTQLITWVTTSIGQEVTRTDTAIAAAAAGARADAIAVEQYAQQLTASAEAYARQLVTDAGSFTRGLVNDAEQAAALGNAQTLAAALAATGAVAVSVQAIRELECIKQCNPLGQLGASIDALDVAALVLLVAEAAHDPKETTAFLTATVKPLIDEGVGLARTVGQL